MAATANDDILDAEIRHLVGLQRYSSGVVRRILRLLRSVDRDLVAQIAAFDPGRHSATARKRLERLLGAMRDSIQEGYAALEPNLRRELTQLADYEAGFQARLIQSAVPIRLALATPPAEQLAAAVTSQPFRGKILAEWASELEAGQYRRVRDALRIGFVEGETIEQMMRRVRGTRTLNYRDGIVEIGRRDAEAVVRTAVNHVATRSRQLLFEANDDLVKAEMWTSTLDGRTTPVCRARDGEVFPVGKGPRPPAHWQCRSNMVPVVKSWSELGFDDMDEDEPLSSRPFVADTRRVRDIPKADRDRLIGQVPANTTYGDWLRNQDRGFVEEVMGKTKAQLFLDGELGIDRFVDRSGIELTLDQLRRREAAAFAKAGLAA